MNCPACQHELKLLQITGIKVHACEGSCGGLWFGWNEIKKLKDIVLEEREIRLKHDELVVDTILKERGKLESDIFDVVT